MDFSLFAINCSFGVDDKNDDNQIIYFIGFSPLTVFKSVSVSVFMFFLIYF